MTDRIRLLTTPIEPGPDFLAATIEDAAGVLSRVVWLKRRSMDVNERTLFLLASQDIVRAMERLEQAATL